MSLLSIPLLPSEVFAGPILRRCEPKQVTVWIATTRAVQLEANVRPAKGTDWTGRTSAFHRFKLFDGLWVHLLRVTPDTGTFPTGKLLEYSIGVLDSDGDAEHRSFAAIVEADALAYQGFTLPTFYLQASGAKLNALYGSCRKPHDIAGGELDALAFGDSLIANNTSELSTRPAVLCLGGDQIYADDVHAAVFDALSALATSLEKAHPEVLPGSVTVPGKGQRQEFMKKSAKFTSGEAENHLVTFAEFVAMYGLVFNVRNWPTSALPPEVEGFRKGLPAVRRLLANTPTYMIFDDHDVTDDWNLSIDWTNQVKASKVGARIITNALAAFWLFQGWGNDPTADNGFVPKFLDAFGARHSAPDELATLMAVRGSLNAWEFATPTVPPIYFLDTRTQRGFVHGFKRADSGAPAYLKSPEAWIATLKRLTAILKTHGRSVPLVLLAPAPIFGFELIDYVQFVVSNPAGPYPFDLEGWAANQGHLYTFLLLSGDADVVVLSGDVHYAYTSSAAFSVFDGDFIRTVQVKFPSFPFPKTGSGTTPTWEFLYGSRFLQLTSSALKNFASAKLKLTSLLSKPISHIVDHNIDIIEGGWKAPNLLKATKSRQNARDVELVPVPVAEVKPNFVLQQRIDDAVHTAYIGKHNLGMVSILGRRVDNFFLVDGKQVDARSWDFATTGAWEFRTTP